MRLLPRWLRGPSAALPAAALLAALAAGPATAREGDDDRPSRLDEVLVTKPQRTAVNRALQWIAEHQQTGGVWGDPSGTRVADTALCTLALMAGGNTVAAGPPLPGGGRGTETLRGPYARNVRDALGYLAKRAWLQSEEKQAGHIVDDAESQMHGHGFAMLVLAEACGNLGPSDINAIEQSLAGGKSPAMLPLADQVRWGLHLAVRLTEAAQDADTGGYGYIPGTGHEGSITVTQITGLRAAMDAGVKVNGAVLKKAYDYVRKSQARGNPEHMGGFAYDINHMERVSYGLTGAGLTTLFGLGRYGGDPNDRRMIDLGLSYMDRTFTEAIDTRGSHSQQWYWYNLFYGSQTLYFAHDVRRIETYWPQMRNAVLGLQLRDGSFPKMGPSSEPGDAEYSTAMGCLILQVPMESLPIFQRR